jgi:PAS domain S-box-containing protein
VARSFIKNTLVLLVAVCLASLGIYNLVLKSTWTLMDDGVFWQESPLGVAAGRVATGGPAERAGVRPGDVLLALDDQEVQRPEQVQARLQLRRTGEPLRYSLLRADEKRALVVSVEPLRQGNLTLFYYLSLLGFFSLIVGTAVMLKRPPDRAALHFYAICLLFFLMYSTSYTGKLNLADWTLLWTDHLAILFLPVVFLHFCLSFPERKLHSARPWLIPVAYLPALLLAGAAVASQVLFLTTGGETFWEITSAIDTAKPIYFGALFGLSFAILVRSYRRTKSVLARKQMKWLVVGTGAGVLPFFALYAVPFALGREPRLAMELAGYISLALIPLSLAYAVVKHRLMDVELIVRRSLIYILATAAVLGICLLAIGLLETLKLGDGESQITVIAVLCTLLVVLLFSPVKTRVQDALDRLFYRKSYGSRRSLLQLSQDLNADLDLERLTERLIDGVTAALSVSGMAVFLREESGDFTAYKTRGDAPEEARLLKEGPLVRRLSAGRPINVELSDVSAEAAGWNLTYYFPCRVRGEVIAVIGVSRKDGFDPLNSEEKDLLQAIAGQAATAFLNGQLYKTLQQKASELQRLTDYNENILESMDSGILVLDLDAKVVRWNRAMEQLYGRTREEVLGRSLDDVFPESFMEALRGSLVLGETEEIASIYKLRLPSADGRSLMVNASVAPFQVDSGERCGSILILDDVTSRVRLEEQLQHSEKMASIGLLAAGVAHEVNTPLTGISSYAQMLRKEVEAGDPKAELLEKIERQTFRASKIINSLLNFSRSSGAELEPLDVNKLVLDVLSLLEPQLGGASIKLRKEFGDGLPRVRGNENRLQQVFFNLILNAKDAMPKGGWLTVVTRADDDTVIAEIKDTGHGIRKEHIKRIYDPFFTTKGLGRGTGLGLSVSYGIVQEHGGAIFVDSVPGKGTTFQVTLPALELQEAARR